MTTTRRVASARATPTLPNIPQEQLDEEAARQYILLGSYRKVAKAIHCDPATALRRAVRWAKRDKRKEDYGNTRDER